VPRGGGDPRKAALAALSFLDVENVSGAAPGRVGEHDGNALPELLATPGALRVLRLLLGSPRVMKGVGDEHPALPLFKLLVKLARAHPRSLLRSGVLAAALTACTGCATGAVVEEWEGAEGGGGGGGGGELRAPQLSSLRAFCDMLGAGAGAAAAASAGREEAACLLHVAVPLLARLRERYRVDGGRLAVPPASTLDDPLVTPQLLSEGAASAGVAAFVSHLCALAMGHWRQWGGAASARARGAATAGGGGGGGGGGGAPRAPANWPLTALAALLDGGLLPVWAAALALHVEAGARLRSAGGEDAVPPPPPPQAAPVLDHPAHLPVDNPRGRPVKDFALRPEPLAALLLALARVLRVCQHEAAAGGARAGEEDTQALFGGTLAHLLAHADAAHEKGVHALLAALAALHAPHAEGWGEGGAQMEEVTK
jgi:hypothetical protein